MTKYFKQSNNLLRNLATRIRIFFHTLRSMRPLNIREPPPDWGGTGGPSAGSAPYIRFQLPNHARSSLL